jgi:hypothetical protein
MSDYYYHACVVKLGLVMPAVTTDLTGCDYQHEKFIKHTAAWRGISNSMPNTILDSGR